MRRLLIALGAVGLLASTAAASPTPRVAFNDWSNLNGGFVQTENPAWNNGDGSSPEWAASTRTADWYLSSHNFNDLSAVNTCGSCEYTQLADDTSGDKSCLTVSGTTPYLLYDYVCTQGKTSQNWGVVPDGIGPDGTKQYALFNQWMEIHVTRCDGGKYNWVIQANNYDQPTSYLHMGCPTTSGQPNVNQVWSIGTFP